MEITDSVIIQIKATTVPVIIFGASYIGKLAYEFCLQNDISVTCFCDSNAHKQGKRVLGTEIVSPTDIVTSYPEAFFIIAVTDIQDVVKQLQDLGYNEWCGAGELLQDFSWNAESHEFNDVKVNNTANYGKYILNTCIRSHHNFLGKENFLYIRSIDLVITEKCSLKCKDCANLMQYFCKPINCDISKVVESSKLLADVCDEINEIRIIGGEPFMNRQWFTIIEELKKINSINYIVIYTNGTIVPKTEKVLCLKEDNIFVNITDYGDISKHSDKLVETLDKNGINYYYYTARAWTACASIKKRNRTADQEKDIFAKCCAKNLITFIEGKIFRCPFAANLDRLIEIPEVKSDFVDLLEITDIGLERVIFREKLRHYLYDIETLKFCDYCAGRFLSDIEIEPGVQTHQPLKISL